MRLMHLEVTGFGAFRSRTEFDFEDADFFALAGPTGSGKSTVIDAVCFALYGSVPRYEDKNLIKYVLTLGASEAKVSLTFELDGDRYVATRVVRRSPRGAVQTKEARLERVGGDVLAGNERDLTAAVVGLLGLRFEDFTRCVVLPQNEFAEFLRSKGDSRRDLMVRLLNLGVYEQVGAKARALADQCRNQMGARQRRLEDLAHATPEARAEAERRAEALTEARDEVTDAQPTLDELTGSAKEARARGESARAAVGRLQGLRVPDDARVLSRELGAVDEELRQETQRLGALEQARQEAETARAALADLRPLHAARDAHGTLVICIERLGEFTKLVETRKGAVEGAEAALTETEAALHAAAEERDASRRAHLAAALAGTLASGEACPVCLQVVSEVPEHPPVPELASADALLASRKQDQDKARNALTATQNELSKAEGQLERLATQRSELEAKIGDHRDPERLAQRIEEIEAVQRAADDARRVEDEARRRGDAVRRRRDGLAEQARKFKADFDTQRDSVVDLGPPPAAHTDLVADWDMLVAWAGTEMPRREEAAQRADGQVEELLARRRAILTGLRSRLAELEVTIPDDARPVDLVTAAVAAATNAESKVVKLREAMDEAKQLEAEIGELAEEAGVSELLGRLLRADRFSQWLVDEALELLVVNAGEMLRELTNGQYSLATTEREFEVIDHGNADEHRPARTLSGGETFQASLALALALSEHVRNLAAEGAPRLDAIVLDEGFGTLDPETLEVVAGTIENLGSTGRMVGIITHVRELALRVPVRFEIRKGHRSSTVERVVA